MVVFKKPKNCFRPSCQAWSSPRWRLATYRFYATRVLGPFMRPYNVPNDRVLAPSTGGVENKQ